MRHPASASKTGRAHKGPGRNRKRLFVSNPFPGGAPMPITLFNDPDGVEIEVDFPIDEADA